MLQIKFLSHCHSDSENIQEIIESEKCAVLTYNTLKHFAWDGELHFKFIIKRKDDDEFTKKKLAADVKVISPPTKSAPNLPPTKNKGTIKTNSAKKSNATPSIIQPVLKPLQIDSPTDNNQFTPATPATSQRSSINACRQKAPTSPCDSPSINKDEDKEVFWLNR